MKLGSGTALDSPGLLRMRQRVIPGVPGDDGSRVAELAGRRSGGRLSQVRSRVTNEERVGIGPEEFPPIPH
jgi:hypothetical protein